MISSASESTTSTSSFQDESLNRKRRSVDQQLTDVSNQLPAKRHCSSRAVVSIAQDLKRKSSRGDSTKANEVRHTFKQHKQQVNRVTTAEADCSNLRSMKRCVYKEGGRRLEQYIDKNTTLEVQKAFALVIFGQCITTDKMGVIEATRVACKFSGFSAEVIRRWATNVFDLFGNVSCVEDVDDDDIVEVLSSKRGCHSKVTSLIIDEQFCIKATKYVRQNGYRKAQFDFDTIL